MKHTAIKEHHLYAKTFAKGKRFSGKYLSVFVLKDHAARRLMLANPEKKYLNRVGLSDTKKIGGAVERNRAKRVIRAAWQMIERKADAPDSQETLARGWLIVISPRETILDAKSPEVGRELRFALRRLDLLKKTAPDADSTPDGAESTHS